MTMTDAPLRFGLVGCGVIAPTHADALCLLPQAALVACCDSRPDRAQAFAERYNLRAVSLDEMLADPLVDAVTVCTPSGLHAQIGCRALRAGKHVLVEKPMDVSLSACDSLAQAAQESGRTLSVVSQHRFDPASVRVKQAMQRGELGALICADARIPWFRTQEYYDSGEWRGTWALDGGGALMNQGVHTVDLLLWICGPVESVYAQTRTLAHARLETEDIACATLSFANGAVGTLLASTALFPGFAARLGVHGARGSAVIEGDTLSLLAVQGQEMIAGQDANRHAMQVAQGGTQAATARRASSALPPSTLQWGDAHRAQLADFIHCCRTGETPLADARGARAAVALVLAVYQSARTGQAVTL